MTVYITVIAVRHRRTLKFAVSQQRNQWNKLVFDVSLQHFPQEWLRFF